MVVSSQLPHQSINHGTAAPNSANGGTTVVAANSASNALAEIADIFDELEASVNRKAKGSKNKKPLKANSALNSLETSNGLPVISSQRTLITTDVLLHRNAMGEYIPGKNGQPLTRNEWPSPGPLDYSPKLPRAGPEFSILGKSNREEFHGDSPGPGYNFSYKVVMTKSPHYSIGMKIKEVEGKNDTPSPLTYNINHKSIGTEGISYSVAGKYHELVPPDGPSPQKYNVSASIGDDSGFSFGLKPGVKEYYSPSPQDYVYDIDVLMRQSPSFTIRPKVEIDFLAKENESRPAPNQYIPILPLSEKMVTLKGVHQEFKPLKTPSPANYIISNVAFTGPQYSLTPKVIPYKEDLLEPSPGPNDYNPKIELMHEAQPSFSFGKKTKILSQLPNAVPGPGTYLPFDRQIKGNDAPKATLKGRRSTKIETTPGPSDYHMETKKTGREHLFMLEKANSGSGGRGGSRKGSNLPGPADYDAANSMNIIQSTGPAYTLGKKIHSSKVESGNPGPNNYFLKGENSEIKNGITMKGRNSPHVMVFPTTRFNTLK